MVMGVKTAGGLAYVAHETATTSDGHVVLKPTVSVLSPTGALLNPKGISVYAREITGAVNQIRSTVAKTYPTVSVPTASQVVQAIETAPTSHPTTYKLPILPPNVIYHHPFVSPPKSPPITYHAPSPVYHAPSVIIPVSTTSAVPVSVSGYSGLLGAIVEAIGVYRG